MSAKLTHLLSSLLAFGLIPCVFISCGDLLNVEADPAKPKASTGSEPAESRRKTTFRLVPKSGEAALPKGTRTTDEQLLEMNRLILKVQAGDEVTGSGNLSINYTDKRTVDVISANIQRISIEKSTVAVDLAISGQEPIVVTEASPLQGEVLTSDRGEVSMAGVPSDDQKKALTEYQGQWFGGDQLFPAHDVRRTDAWQAKPEQVLEALFGSNFTQASGSVDMHVKRLLSLDGHRCAEISIALNRCKGTTKDKEGKETLMEVHGYGTLFRALDIFHVLKADLSGTVVVTMPGPQNLTFKGSGGFNFTATSSVEVGK